MARYLETKKRFLDNKKNGANKWNREHGNYPFYKIISKFLIPSILSKNGERNKKITDIGKYTILIKKLDLWLVSKWCNFTRLLVITLPD